MLKRALFQNCRSHRWEQCIWVFGRDNMATPLGGWNSACGKCKIYGIYRLKCSFKKVVLCLGEFVKSYDPTVTLSLVVNFSITLFNCYGRLCNLGYCELMTLHWWRGTVDHAGKAVCASYVCTQKLKKWSVWLTSQYIVKVHYIPKIRDIVESLVTSPL